MEIAGKVLCQVTGLIKCSKPSRINKPIIFHAYIEDKLLCTVACSKEYFHIKQDLWMKNTPSSLYPMTNRTTQYLMIPWLVG